MTVDELFSLKPGDKFRVYWAKDDDPRNNLVFDYELFEVGQVTPSVIWSTCGEVWERARFVSGTAYNTSRGYAHFYRP